MAPAKPVTKWRRTIKQQLEKSKLATSNEMAYRSYVSIIHRLSMSNKLGEDLSNISRPILFRHIREFLANNVSQPWEADVLWYTANLLMDASEGIDSPPFQGASMVCGECGLPAKLNDELDRYVCPYCNAQAKAGPNRIPIAIPASNEIRDERVRLHERLSNVIGNGVKNANVRDLYYRKIASLINKPIENTHIGYITTIYDVALWDMAIDALSTMDKLVWNTEAANV
ncbi:hypothetical protein HUO09_16945 [Vibrio sp. Y2-5]|nr:hypothetical protein [Vibrio sp. Y2-5]MBD0788043.1 hypothetical protein [Vibrio sp. Y2-5]